MAGLRLLFVGALPVCGAALTLDLGNWMGQLAPVIGDATLLDLSMPGTHDTMSYDLSNDLSEGYEGLGPVLSKILHTVTPVVGGRFIREQSRAQGLNITGMLDSGVRYIDFRIMYTDAPNTILPHKNWYCLHGCQSRRTALEYLTQVRAWLDAHPKEILVFFSSRHGSQDLVGTDQYPSTNPAERQAFFRQVCSVFTGMLFNSSMGPLNVTSVRTLWERGQRVIWYAADYAESTNNSSLALEARLMDDQNPDAGPAFGSLTYFLHGTATRTCDKAQNRFFVVSMSNSGTACQIEAAALLTFLPGLARKRVTERCAKCFGIPGMDSWCPMTLQDVSLLNNYYNQRLLDHMYRAGELSPDIDFPNALYLDAVDTDGRIRTGTSPIGPFGSVRSLLRDEHATEGFAYAATVVGATVRRLCKQARRAASEACLALTQAVAAARAAHPVKLWNDTLHGRLAGWPPIPGGEQVVV